VAVCYFYFVKQPIRDLVGGEGGIRTLETVARLHAFQACAFDHSATSPPVTAESAELKRSDLALQADILGRRTRVAAI
jgi:hypothetical protein